MTSSKLFTSNRRQAIRLPKAVAFPDDVQEVDILKIGRSRLIVPRGERWNDFFNAPVVSSYYPDDRDQSSAEQREPL